MEKIYLDYNATTPTDPRVLEVMTPYFVDHFGNPASGQHAWGWTAESALHKAREQTARLIGAKPQEIYFTSGATEANNWALFGLFFQTRMSAPQEKFHLITTAVEHSSVLNASRALADLGAEVDILPVDENGQVDPARIEAAMKPHTKLVSAIWANNEIGTLNRMQEIGEICRSRQVYLHTDGTQAVGKVQVDLSQQPIDLLSFSGHKMYGPKGVGALYIRSSHPHVSIKPLFFGGGHEKGLRSGTPNVPGIVGLGAASELCRNEMDQEIRKARELRDRLWSRLTEGIPGVRMNGHPTERSPINLAIMLPKTSVDSLLPKLQGLGFSTGSACSAGRVSISHVLAGLGRNESEASRSFRLSLGRWTTEAEVDRAAELLIRASRDASAS